jgi:hypothetical protein
MSDQHSLFFDEWKACLRAHYVYVLRAGDHVTEPTLRQVLLQTGLSEEDLQALQEDAFALGTIEPSLELMPPSPAALDAEPDDLLDSSDVLHEELEDDTVAEEDEGEVDGGPPVVPSAQLPLF